MWIALSPVVDPSPRIVDSMLIVIDLAPTCCPELRVSDHIFRQATWSCGKGRQKLESLGDPREPSTRNDHAYSFSQNISAQDGPGNSSQVDSAGPNRNRTIASSTASVTSQRDSQVLRCKKLRPSSLSSRLSSHATLVALPDCIFLQPVSQ